MNNQSQNLDSIFHPLSRIIIVVPIAIVLLALFLKITGNIPLTQNSLQVLPSPTKIQLDPQLITNSAKFNLQGPLICLSDDGIASMSAYVMDKKILFNKIEKKGIQNVLLKGDCVYIWKLGNFSGEKICGVSQYISLAEGFLASGIIEPSSIFEKFNQMFAPSSESTSQASIKSLLSSCVAKEIPKTVEFNVPNNILFKNKDVKLLF